MNREIKFRGKTIGIGHGWYYGYYVEQEEEHFIYLPEPEMDLEVIKVIPETVGQYTGLKDCNGKEIYEGDRVKCLRNGLDTGSPDRIIFKNGSFFLANRYITLASWLSNTNNEHDFEIIGNIYENLELCKERKR